MFESFDRGREADITYPVSRQVTRRGCEGWEKRSIVIHAYRDLGKEPLTVAEFLQRPFLRRSRWLVRAWEPKSEQWRQFYLGSTKEFTSPGLLSLGLFQAGCEAPVWIYHRVFKPTVDDRKELVRLVHQWSKVDFGDCKLGIFAIDDGEMPSVLRPAL